MTRSIALAAFLLLGPLAGGLLDGAARVLSARLQSRVGPPLLQPFYDFFKLMQKERALVRRLQVLYMVVYLLFTVLAGALFFSGDDILLFYFCLTLANAFFVLAGYSSTSPFSHVGAERELIQLLSYEPALMLVIVGFYVATGSFQVRQILAASAPLALYLPGCLITMVPMILVKQGRSPFDLSTSHHAHQEIVKGITSDFSASTLAMLELVHWYKNCTLYGLVALFFSFSWWAALLAVAAVFLLTVLLDNSFGRFTYGQTLRVLWAVTLAAAFGNITVLYVLRFFSPVLLKGGA